MNVTIIIMIILLYFQGNGVCLYSVCLELGNRTEFVNYISNQFLISNGIHSVVVVHGKCNSNIDTLMMKLIDI